MPEELRKKCFAEYDPGYVEPEIHEPPIEPRLGFGNITLYVYYGLLRAASEILGEEGESCVVDALADCAQATVDIICRHAKEKTARKWILPTRRTIASTASAPSGTPNGKNWTSLTQRPGLKHITAKQSARRLKHIWKGETYGSRTIFSAGAEAVLGRFYDISQIPRGSGNNAQISAYLQNFCNVAGAGKRSGQRRECDRQKTRGGRLRSRRPGDPGSALRHGLRADAGEPARFLRPLELCRAGDKILRTVRRSARTTALAWRRSWQFWQAICRTRRWKRSLLRVKRPTWRAHAAWICGS